MNHLRSLIRFGPFKRKPNKTGVPSDRFAPWRNVSRHARFDHRGRVTVLIAEGETATELKALPVSAGPLTTDDGPWDGPGNTKNLNNDDGEAEYKQAFAWVDDSADPDTKAAYSFIHHFVDDSGKVGAASTVACSSGIGILNGGRGVSVKDADWYGDRDGIYAHLAAHLKASGVKAADLPDLDDMAIVEGRDFAWFQNPEQHYAALHEGKEITHTHAHATYGAQGGDKTHSHQHTHSGDANHAHHISTASVTETVTPITSPEHLAAKVAELRAKQLETPDVERNTVKLSGILTASGEPIEVDLPVRWDPDVVTQVFDKELRSFVEGRGAFVSTIDGVEPFAMVAAGADLPQLVDDPGDSFQSYLCIEGVRTDEGYFSRELMPGSCLFPDLPVSMRLQIEDEGGHYGAVTCGRIDTMERVPYPEGDGLSAIMATGVFGTDENGQLAQLLVTEQTQRFVSVDLRDMESEIVEVCISVSVSSPYADPWDDDDEDGGGAEDWWLRVTSAVIGGATIVAMPALQQAVITLSSVDLPTAPLALERSPATAVTVTASAGDPAMLSTPPEAWFENPGFHVGDPRLVRQPDGHYACPLTVTDEGQVFGHAAHWGAEHTAVRNPRNGKGVSPPHSPTYAHFMTGSLTTAEGTDVAVGPITMDCGHAPVSAGVSTKAAIAHYDGGYGVTQIANVRMGEDDFGIWFAGSLCELRSDTNERGPTEEQIRRFKTWGVSGDWREINRKPHLIACLAVPVPGFPIARESLVASAAIDQAIADGQLTVSTSNDAGEVVALVAAGRVCRMTDGEKIDQLSTAVEILMGERRARLRQEAIDRLSRL